MDAKILLLFSCLSYLVVEEACGQTYGIAVFNIRGIKGFIKFMPIDNSDNVTVVVNINGTNQNHHWHVHTLPVDPTLPPQIRCSNDWIGGHYDPLGAVNSLGSSYGTYCSTNNQTACEIGDLSGKLGPLTSGVSRYVDTTGLLKLFGRYGIIGRSVKIHGREDVCATIVSSREMSTVNKPKVTMLQSSFTYPVGGTIYMRQVEGEEAVIFGKVYWVTDSMTTVDQKWHVHAAQPSEFYKEGNCTDVGGHYNPFAADINGPDYAYCGPDNLTACEVGDLSGKHGGLTISSNPFKYNQYSFLYHDSFINLTGVNAVIDRSISIHYNGPVIACAPLVLVEELSVSTYFGMFSATQSSKFAPTVITTNYQAADLTVFNAAIAPNRFCQATFASGRSAIYNPHSAPSLDGSDNTPDRYPVGDISKKYNFTNQSRVSELPLQGFETIAGHTLGLAKRSASSTQYTCSSLWPKYPSGANIKMAKATFNNTVSGAIYFIQRNFGNGLFGNTFIFVDIWYTDPRTTSTMGHNWHIHVNPPQVGQECGNVIGGHFNPFNVNISSAQSYTTKCSVYSPLRCESGDLSGKHSRLNISPSGANRTTYTYIDSNLFLWGSSRNSIIGRSVGLHLTAAQGGSLFDCGEIKEVVAASKLANFTFSYNSTFDRTQFATRVTDNVKDASPSDLLMVRQVMTTDTTGTSCVDMSVRVLGSSVDDANAKLNDIESQFNNLYGCSGAMKICLSSLLLFVLIFIGSLLN